MEASYQQFADSDDSEDTPQGSGIKTRIVPESERAARWNHIEDLDSFLTNVYQYHQKHGFTVIAMETAFVLLKSVFVVIVSAYLIYCVDYNILFINKFLPNKTNKTDEKVSLSDALLGCHECVQTVDTKIWCFMIIASLFKAVVILYQIFQYYDVKAFYNEALKIDDRELDNYTWYEVQTRVLEVLPKQQMCMHKKDLTQLDIYHRILRSDNYLVAMINKGILPLKMNIPLFGETMYLTPGLQYNIKLIVYYWGRWSLLMDSCHLKKKHKEQMLTNLITCVATVDCLLMPWIFLWKILYFIFIYADILKREPGILSTYCWSLYGKIYLRHFNELDHELNKRLNRAYGPASEYMNSSSNPLITVLAQNLAFFVGSIAAVLLILSLFDDVFNVKDILSSLSFLYISITILRKLIPDENTARCPEDLMTEVLKELSYIPDSWKGKAHTSKVRQEFAQLFQSKATYLVSELLSPIVTPFILMYYIKPKALDIVDFYRKFTAEVVGAGNVCSFAQMDVRLHGNPKWQPKPAFEPPPDMQAKDGKTELSLMHFIKMNPDWQPPADAREFIKTILSGMKMSGLSIKKDSENDDVTPSMNPRYVSRSGLSSNSQEEIRSREGGWSLGTSEEEVSLSLDFEDDDVTPSRIRTGLTSAEGPFPYCSGLTNQQQPSNYSLRDSVLPEGVSITHDMSSITLHLHHLHHRRVRLQQQGIARKLGNSNSKEVRQRPSSVVSSTLAGTGSGASSGSRSGDERTPLLTTAAAAYYNPS